MPLPASGRGISCCFTGSNPVGTYSRQSLFSIVSLPSFPALTHRSVHDTMWTMKEVMM